MITFPMLLLVIVPLVAGIEVLCSKRTDDRVVAVLAGLCFGAMVWNAFGYWQVSLISVAVLVAVGVTPVVRLLWLGAAMVRDGLIAAVVTIALLFAGWQGLLGLAVNASVVSEVEIVNPIGDAGTALLVYHPGRSGYQETLIGGFADGLVGSGWRVEITTASKEAPTDLSEYDLLVLSAPTYDWLPAKPIQRYLKQLGDLDRKDTVAIVSAAGTTTQSLPMLEDLVRQSNGDLIASYALWTLLPNRIKHGSNDPVEIMRRAAEAVPIPAE